MTTRVIATGFALEDIRAGMAVDVVLVAETGTTFVRPHIHPTPESQES